MHKVSIIYSHQHDRHQGLDSISLERLPLRSFVICTVRFLGKYQAKILVIGRFPVGTVNSWVADRVRAPTWNLRSHHKGCEIFLFLDFRPRTYYPGLLY